MVGVDGTYEFDTTTGNGTQASDVLVNRVTKDATVKVDIYIYYDGNDEAVKTSNISNLDGVSVSISFTID